MANGGIGSGNGTIQKFDSSGIGSLIASDLTAPVDLAFDASGILFFSNVGTTHGGGTIEKLDSSGVASVFASGFTNPYGIAFDSGGNLYLVNSGENEILKYNSSGVGSVFASSGLDFPVYIAVQAVPEPNSFMISIGLGLVGAMFLARRSTWNRNGGRKGNISHP